MFTLGSVMVRFPLRSVLVSDSSSTTVGTSGPSMGEDSVFRNCITWFNCFAAGSVGKGVE